MVHVHRDPDDGVYRDTTTARAGEVLTLALLPDVALPVADLLGLS